MATSPAFEKGRDFSKTLGEETEAANEDLSPGMMRAGGVDGLEHRDTSCGPVSGEALRGQCTHHVDFLRPGLLV